MGNEAEKIFKSFGLNDANSKNYDAVIQKYNEHFIPKRNTIHERAKFYQRRQKSGESAEQYIRSLHELADNCQFEGNKEEQIRDAIVIGIKDRELSERMQLKEELTLQMAVTMARQSEMVKGQVQEQVPSPYMDTNEVRGARPKSVNRQNSSRVSRRQKQQQQQNRQQKQGNPTTRCTRCNRQHGQNNCPAMGKTCNKCGKINHFAVCCKTKTLHEIDSWDGRREEDSNNVDSVNCGLINCDNGDEAWMTTLNICKSNVSFKIDTGADVSIISESCFKNLKARPALRKSKTILKSPGGNVNCKGYFIAETYRENQKYLFRVYVVSGQSQTNLLSRGASAAMKFVKRVDEIPTSIFGRTGLINCEPVKIQLKENAVPYSVNTARRIPFPLLPKVEQKLNDMIQDGIIEKVSEPSDWCAPMCPVVKPNGDVRITVDYKKLNESVKREIYMLKNLDDISPKLVGMTVFSKLDASNGFFQIPLDEESSKLTTFITPLGRFCYRRVPMGANLSPEIFQKKMTELIANLQGVDVIMDDFIIYGRDMTEHDANLEALVKRIEVSGLKLNPDKCVFRKPKIEFFGHTISTAGVSPSPTKVQAVNELEPPTNKTELQRVLGLINYLGRFVDNLSTIISPMTELLRNDTAWHWGPNQAKAFDDAKRMITNAPCLAFYDPTKQIVVTADASRQGLGGTLYVQDGSNLRPVAFCSRSLNVSEKRWAQIELECLSLVFACEKFSRYLIGLDQFKLITDHKPLIPLINTSDIDKVPIRCQRLLMRLRRFNCVAEYCKGSDLVVSDALSRSPLKTYDTKMEDDITAYVNSCTSQLQITDRRMTAIKEATEADSNMQKLIRLTRDGWPRREKSLPKPIRSYFKVRNELSVTDDLLIYRQRIVIPESQQNRVLEQLHKAHQGIVKSKELAAQCVWWPSINKDIEDAIKNCQFCQEERPSNPREPLKTSAVPKGPWEKIAADVCEMKNKQYLVVYDYYSKYLEISLLYKATSESIIGKMTNMFSIWGDPMELVTDCGSVFKSQKFREFACKHNFTQTFTSPHYHQSNFAESGVKIAKKILRQPNQFDAIRSYRNTPTAATGYSPNQLMLGRNTRTEIPCVNDKLVPKWPKISRVKQNSQRSKRRQEYFYNRKHGVKILPKLKVGDNVRIKIDSDSKWNKRGTVIQCRNDRSFVIRTDNGLFTRNRRHLQLIPKT